MSDDLVVETDIPFGSAYAYRRGDKIKREAVDRNEWHDYVVGANTKAGREAQGLPEEAPKTEAPKSADTAAGGKDK